MSKVGVVIPMYNAARYITKALGSVAAQDFKDLEVFIRDDCSTDSSMDVALDWIADATAPFSLHFAHNTVNLGWARNTNRVVSDALASGCEYVFLLGADDWIAPDAITKLVQTLEDNNVDFVCPDGVVWEDGKFVARHTPRDDARWEDFKTQNWLTGFPLLKASMWEDLGGFETVLDKKGAFEDWEFWIRALKAGYTYRCLHGDFYFYRSYPEQTSRHVNAGEYVPKMLKKHFNESNSNGV